MYEIFDCEHLIYQSLIEEMVICKERIRHVKGGEGDSGEKSEPTWVRVEKEDTQYA